MLALVAASLVAEAQPAGKVWRIGFFSVGSRATIEEGGVPAAFRQGLLHRGYIEGENIAIEYRWEFGVHDRIPTAAAELAQLNLDLIFAFGDKAIAATKRLTQLPRFRNRRADISRR